MTKLHPILEKPSCGWSHFYIGDFDFPISYLRNTPQDFIDAFTDTLKNGIASVVVLDGEGLECTIVIQPYAGVYTIVNKSDNEDLNNDIEIKYFHINLKRVVEQFIKDIETYANDWAMWDALDENDKKYYDLNELKELIK